MYLFTFVYLSWCGILCLIVCLIWCFLVLICLGDVFPFLVAFHRISHQLLESRYSSLAGRGRAGAGQAELVRFPSRLGALCGGSQETIPCTCSIGEFIIFIVINLIKLVDNNRTNNNIIVIILSTRSIMMCTSTVLEMKKNGVWSSFCHRYLFRPSNTFPAHARKSATLLLT